MSRALYAYPPARMDADEAARYLGVSRTKFLRRVDQGEYPPSVQDGANRLWLTEDLDDYIRRRHSKAPNRGKPQKSVEEEILEGAH